MCFDDAIFGFLGHLGVTSLKHIFLHRIDFPPDFVCLWRYLLEQAHMLVKGICC